MRDHRNAQGLWVCRTGRHDWTSRNDARKCCSPAWRFRPNGRWERRKDYEERRARSRSSLGGCPLKELAVRILVAKTLKARFGGAELDYRALESLSQSLLWVT